MASGKQSMRSTGTSETRHAFGHLFRRARVPFVIRALAEHTRKRRLRARDKHAVFTALPEQDDRPDRRRYIFGYARRTRIENAVRGLFAHVHKRAVAIDDPRSCAALPERSLCAFTDAARTGKQDGLARARHNVRAVQHEHPARGKHVKQPHSLQRRADRRTGAISARKDHIRVRTMRHGVGKARNIPRRTDPLQKVALCARLPAKHIIAPQRVRRRCGQRIAEPETNRVIRYAVRHSKRFAHRRAFERRIGLQREGHAAEAIKLTVHRSQTAAHSHLRESGWYSCSGSRLPRDL